MQRRMKESLPVSKIAIIGNVAKVGQIRQNCQKLNHQMYDLFKKRKLPHNNGNLPLDSNCTLLSVDSATFL